MNVQLISAGSLAVLAAAIHGGAGEVLVVRRLSPETLSASAFGGPSMTRAMIHVTWHVTTIAFLAVGIALLLSGSVLEGDAARAVGLVAAHGGRLGRLGQAGLIVEVVGVVMTAALAAIEAIVFPVLADRAPTLLAIDGPLLGSPLFIGAGVLALGWPLGLALLGLAAARSRVFDRSPGILLAVSGPLFLGLEGPFVPVVGGLSAVLFGVAQMWWGLLLWRSAVVPEPTAA